MTVDLKETLFLPKTSFSMRACLSEKEPYFLNVWAQENLYEKLMQKHKNAPVFILHDGPPYANGHAHMGHALNRILKDFILRSQSMLGRRTPFVPGWDCHGLPIEWKVEEDYRTRGLKKEAVPVLEFRQACRKFAKKWIDIQRNDMQRLGLLGDWENPYITMTFQTEARILKTLFHFVNNNQLVKGFKPVYWSVVEQTALAEAEIEYQEKKSPSIYVTFSLTHSKDRDLIGARCLIWTTTPWTLPGNRAIAYRKDIDYVMLQLKESGQNLQINDHLILATPLVPHVMEKLNISQYKVIKKFKGAALEGAICHHPFVSLGYRFPVPLLHGAHVTTDTGTGLVHTAPSHGMEDFLLGQQHGLEIPMTLTDSGHYTEKVPGFEGTHVFKADILVIAALNDQHALVSQDQIVHSYPHSWRSKAPLIQRATAQWFMPMEHLRDTALKAAQKVMWMPSFSAQRMINMLENRPDWCLSRQRIWGVPLALFLNKHTGELLKDPKVQQRILDTFTKEGSDAWFTERFSRFLEPEYDPQEFEPVRDILDVWFDSGVSHTYALDQHPDLKAPADLYLEGSDQHRGWFQSSLLTRCALDGTAPYKAVLTHGFVLDEKGYKMSKSAGNTLTPQEIIKTHGAEMLRLWVALSDFTEDLRIGKNMLRHQQDIYRRIRNTFRYVLGALSDYAGHKVVYTDLFFLEQWILHRLWELNQHVIAGYKHYCFSKVITDIHHFCAVDLSAFYFDIRKDALYCDDQNATRRLGAQFVFDQVLSCLNHWLAPILIFTAEEVWRHHHPTTSIHLETFPALPSKWHNQKVADHMKRLRDYRRVITGSLEEQRLKNVFCSSLEAHVSVYDPEHILDNTLPWAEFAIVSTCEIIHTQIPSEAYRLKDVPKIGVIAHKAEGEKCKRCWQILQCAPTPYGPLCVRCHTCVKKNEKV